MKQLLQIIADIVSIALAIAVLGGAYIYLNPDHAGVMVAQLRAWLSWSATPPALSLADGLLIAAMLAGLASTVTLIVRRKKLLRGPVKVILVR